MVFVEGGKRQTIFGKALAAYRLHEISERDEKGNVSFARMAPLRYVAITAMYVAW